MKYSKTKSMITYGLLLFSIVLYSQNEDNVLIAIDSIIGNPGKFNNEFVSVQGQVTQYSPGDSQTTASYIVMGEYGVPITVTTMDEKPSVFKIYEVAGTVVIDPYTKEPYLIEKSKLMIKDASGINNPMVLFAMFGGFLILAVLIIVLIVRTSKPPGVVTISPQGAGPEIGYDNDFKTIRIPLDSPKTLKLMPGKLVVTAGLDKGKEFMISGYPSEQGNVVSIGRETVSGEKGYSHIQLTEKTVSRKQAEIVQMDGKLFLRNLSETNYTQLNGEELSPEQQREVEADSVIRMGELEFKYVI